MNEENLNQVPQPTVQPTGSAQMQDFNNTYKNDTGKKRNKGLVILLAILCPLTLFGIALALILPRLGHDAPDPGPNPLPIPISYENNGAFSLDFLRQAYATDQRGSNILVSPYSMESVWRLALPGANGETQQEISTALGGERTMKKFPQLKVANAMFVRDSFAPQVKPEFTANFDGDLRYDSFASAEPINSWVKESTDGMIDGVLDQAPDNEMMIMLLNAIAMDEKWSDKFECDNTMSAEFTKTSGDTMDVSMMGGSAERYFKTENAEGVVREYKAYDDGSAFEFVGILPNGSVREYLDKFDEAELTAMSENEIKDGAEESDGSVNKVSVRLPRFSYDYTMPNALGVMQNLGIKKAFDQEAADFSNMVDLTGTDYENVYINQVIQKTHIELNEAGTKAAAVSALGMYATSALDTTKYNYYAVIFNKPFVYMIRDKETKEIIFAGVVEVPEEWSGSTCEGEED